MASSYVKALRRTGNDKKQQGIFYVEKCLSGSAVKARTLAQKVLKRARWACGLD